jgi:hypothetical protein
MGTLTGFDVQLPSQICDPTIVKDLKRTPATDFFCDLQELELHQTSLQIMYFNHIGAKTRHASCIDCVQSFDLLAEISL